MRQVQTTFAAALLLAAVAPAAAQVYKSIDADGNVVYSSSPFAGTDPDRVESVRIDPAPSASERAAAERRIRAAQTPPGSGSAGSPGDAEAQEAAQQPESKPKPQAIDWQDDEAIQRARTPRREARGAGGFSGEQRGRSGGNLPNQRTSR